MKYIKYGLAILLILVIGFFLKGIFSSEVEYQNQIKVNKNFKDSWEIMTDESSMSKWLKGYIKTELIEGKVNTVGAVSNIYFQNEGQEIVIKETITDIKLNKSISMNFDSEVMIMEYEMTFDEQNNGTVISSKTKAKGKGLFFQSLFSFMESSLYEQEQTNLNNLKALINVQ